MGADTIDFADFEKHYQYCKRCTEHKYLRASMGSTLKEVRPRSPLLSSPSTNMITYFVHKVIVRKIPQQFEKDEVKSCLHFQWTWCPRIQDNPKCLVRTGTCCSCRILLPPLILFLVRMPYTFTSTQERETAVRNIWPRTHFGSTLSCRGSL